MRNKHARESVAGGSSWQRNKIPYIVAIVLLIVAGSIGAFVIKNQPVSAKEESGRTDAGDAGVQIVRMAVTASSYQPAMFTVKEGQLVKWIVDGSRASGCTKYLVAQDIGVSKRLEAGENIIEFTPLKKGTINFMCSMGMVRGQFQVV